MKYSNILDTNSSDWNLVLKRYSDIYNQLHFTKEYHQLMESNGDGEGKLFIFNENEHCLIIPFIQKEINKIGNIIIKEKLYDIKSVFGYTGVITNTEEMIFNNKALDVFTEFCVNQNIISGLLRFNPIIRNQKYVENKYNISAIKKYVYLGVDFEESHLLSNYSPRLRSYIRKGKNKYSNHVKISIHQNDLDDFINLYKTHMREINADEYYLFSEEYYRDLKVLIQNYGFIIYVKIDNTMVAGLMFLYKNQVA